MLFLNLSVLFHANTILSYKLEKSIAFIYICGIIVVEYFVGAIFYEEEKKFANWFGNFRDIVTGDLFI